MERKPFYQAPGDDTRLIDLNCKNFEGLLEKFWSKKMIDFDSNKINQKQPEEVQYKSRKETAAFLKITLPTLNSHTKSGKLTAYFIGRRVLYRADQLELALRQKTKYISK
ncbi:MAG: helix-turn-helix domain-containing protein [Bacteroidota bacterium]